MLELQRLSVQILCNCGDLSGPVGLRAYDTSDAAGSAGRAHHAPYVGLVVSTRVA